MNKKTIGVMSMIFPGSGHLYLKQKKAAIFGIIFSIIAYGSVIFKMIPTFALLFVNQTEGAYEGTVTIGAEEFVNDSFLILVTSSFYIIVILAFLVIAYAFRRDALKVYERKQEGLRIQTYKEKFGEVAKDIIPHAITAPAFVLIFIFLLLPAIVSFFIVFTNYETPILPPAFLIGWVGFDNFTNVFTDPKTSAVFRETMTWTLQWTFFATMGSICLGTFLAVVTHNKRIKGKKFIRTVFLLPWAVPAFLTILIFQIFFSKIGAMNTVVIPFLTGGEYSAATAIPFLTDPNLAKITIICIQSWLGFSYVYILVTGIIQAIPDDLYEAASIDGGNAWTNFWDITFPIILISAAPLFITQFTFNFNNVSIIYMLGAGVVKEVGSQYGPLETIASLTYQLTLQEEFAMAATFGLMTSVVVSTIVLFSWIKTGAFKNEEVM